MAKALYGHMALSDRRILAENARLRQRVRDLEDRIEQLEVARSIDLSELDSSLDRDLVPSAAH
jgi:hypothetical protein